MTFSSLEELKQSCAFPVSRWSPVHLLSTGRSYASELEKARNQELPLTPGHPDIRVARVTSLSSFSRKE